jgi:hypothetical protein
MKILQTRYLIPVAAAAALATTAQAQVIYDTVGGNYTQDFSSLSWNSNGTGGTWTNNSTLTGWSIHSTLGATNYISSYGGATTSANLQGGNGTEFVKLLQISTASNTYDGNNRFGFRSSGFVNDVFFTLRLTNTTGSVLNQFSLSYEAAQFVARDGGVLQVRWSSDNSTWTVINGNGNTQGNATLTYNAPVTSNGTSYNLTLSEVNNSIQNLSSTVSGITWNNNSDLYVQFAFWRSNPPASGSSAPVVAIDNVNFVAVPEPTTWALLAAGLSALVIFRRRRND